VAQRAAAAAIVTTFCARRGWRRSAVRADLRAVDYSAQCEQFRWAARPSRRI